MNELAQQAAKILGRVHENTPLVHHITNLVVTNVTANATLAVGGSPVMAHAKEEAGDMARLASCVVLNIGTLDPEQIEAMIIAGKAANDAGIPVVLDPVGVGATPLRTTSTQHLLEEVDIDILRGNVSEVSILGGFGGMVKGVDAAEAGISDLAAMARGTAKTLGCTVAITGKTDYVSDGTTVYTVDNGHPLLTHVTGTGCMATAVIGCFRGVETDSPLAAAAALACYGFAAEQAAVESDGPGTFNMKLFDALYNLTEQELEQGIRMAKL